MLNWGGNLAFKVPFWYFLKILFTLLQEILTISFYQRYSEKVMIWEIPRWFTSYKIKVIENKFINKKKTIYFADLARHWAKRSC